MSTTQNREYVDLMIAMGAPRWDGFNPIAPRSHRWMMDIQEEDETRGIGWVFWRTIDRDPEGKTGPPKKRRTAIAHDTRVPRQGWLKEKHMAEDLGIPVAKAAFILNRLAAKGVVSIDEDGRISPNGNAPPPRRIEGEHLETDIDDWFCTESFPQPLIDYFQSLSENEREQYMRRYKRMHPRFRAHLKALAPEARTLHTWRYLEGVEYDEQLDADAMAAARAMHVAEQRMAEAGFTYVTTGRPRVSRELTIKLEVRVDPETWRRKSRAADFVQNGSSPLYETQNGPVQNSPPISCSSTVHTALKNHRGSENVENEEPQKEKKVAAKTTPRSKPVSFTENLPEEDQDTAVDETPPTQDRYPATAASGTPIGHTVEKNGFDPSTYNAQYRSLKRETGGEK